MNRLQYALQQAVESDPRFRDPKGRPSYRKAAETCELSSNVISNYVASGHPPLPSLETLATYSEVFGWPLCTVVHWALDREPPAETPRLPGAVRLEQLLEELGVSDAARRRSLAAAILTWVSSSDAPSPPPAPPPTRSHSHRT